MQTTRTVLVVEDEAVVRFDITEHLIESGFTVLEAANSAEAFEHLETQPNIDFLITDIAMPGTVDGLILAKFAAERWPHVRVMVISGKHKAEITDMPDGSTFLSKPYDLTAISRELKGWE